MESDTDTAAVADAMAAVLADHGVRFAFGIPGNDVLPLLRACDAAGIRFVLARSEPAAAFMADAVWQLSGAPGVLIAALGPGLANAISGIAGALMERSALLILAGDMPARQQGIYNHQVFDHLALAAPVTKLALTLNPERAAQVTARALDVACAHPAGPVLLNCPADATRAPAPPQPALAPRRPLVAVPDAAGLAAARGLLAAAARPLALFGRNALAAGAAARRFVDGWGVPFLATYKAKGVVDEHHPLCLGAVGLSPVLDAEAMRLVEAADLLVCIGFDPIELRDAWIDAWPAARPVLTIDAGPQTHRVFPAGLEAVGEVAATLGLLAEDAAARAAWAPALLDGHRARVAQVVRPRDPAEGISPAALFHAIDERMAADWVLTVDVGAHRILANHVLRCRLPGQLVQSNGLCCMGYGLPAAIGAQLARPDAIVVALVGDGGAMMSAGELAVATELGLPIVLVVLNDSALSLIRLKQNKLNLPELGVGFGAHRFDLLGRAFGADSVRVDGIAGFHRAFDAAIAARRPTLIDAVVDPAEYWEQM